MFPGIFGGVDFEVDYPKLIKDLFFSKIGKAKTVWLYCRQKTDSEVDIVDQLARTLNKEIPKNGNLKIERCQLPPSNDDSSPLIVICLNGTRLGTDYINALRDVHGGDNVAVLVCHHGPEHSLPQVPSKLLLRGTEYTSVKAIIDIAFRAKKGLYDCSMNRQAYQQLKTFLKTDK